MHGWTGEVEAVEHGRTRDMISPIYSYQNNNSNNLARPSFSWFITTPTLHMRTKEYIKLKNIHSKSRLPFTGTENRR